MNLRSQLRIFDPIHADLERVCQHHSGREVIATQEGTLYLQLLLVDENARQANAFFSIELWFKNMANYLPAIPWQQVPCDYLIQWLNTLQLNFLVEDSIWTVENVSKPEKIIPAKLLALTAEPCTLFCLDWPSNESENSVIGSSYSQIPLNLRYVVGTSQVKLSELSELVIGDLILIRQQSSYLAIGQSKLFSFCYQENDEVIVEKYIFDDRPSELLEEEHVLDWSKLSVDVEFVLDNKIITLGQLDDINVGSILPVSAGAEQKIKIYLNRKFFALGELVAIENGGLAVEINKINIIQDNGMRISDV